MKHVPRKRFGQNFLVDRAIIDTIVRAIDPQPGDLLVEIGPGLGALTEPLMERLRGTVLHAVELDRDLAARLRQRHPASHLRVHEADALAFDFLSIVRDCAQTATDQANVMRAAGAADAAQSSPPPLSPPQPHPLPLLRIAGNLPYNISSPLLFHLMEFAGHVRDQHFMLQKEVVDRMVATPGQPAYGRLSVMLRARYDMEMLFEVPPESFDPPPKVMSAVVRMQPLPLNTPASLRIDDFALFGQLVAQAFSQRRKMLRNTLKEYGTLLEELGIAPTSRAEELPVETYAALANRVAAGH